MEKYKLLTIDYIEGRISPSEYEALVDTDEGLYKWIQSIVPKDKTFGYCEPPSSVLIRVQYDIRLVMKVHERLDHGGPRGSLGYHYYIHTIISDLFQMAFPDTTIEIDVRPKMLNELKFACPRYIGGSEIAENNILTNLLSDIPTTWPKSKQIKTARERINKAFYIEKGKYPHWIQEPEWPVSRGKPMKYVETIRVNREYVQHRFIDVDTNEERVVNDFH